MIIAEQHGKCQTCSCEIPLCLSYCSRHMPPNYIKDLLLSHNKTHTPKLNDCRASNEELAISGNQDIQLNKLGRYKNGK